MFNLVSLNKRVNSLYHQVKTLLANNNSGDSEPLKYVAFVHQPEGVKTSGLLTVGVKYMILNYHEGDDFTNVGATENVSINEFTATSTTPTDWSNGSKVAACPVVDVVYDTITGIEVILTGSNSMRIISNGKLPIGKTFINEAYAFDAGDEATGTIAGVLTNYESVVGYYGFGANDGDNSRNIDIQDINFARIGLYELIGITKIPIKIEVYP